MQTATGMEMKLRFGVDETMSLAFPANSSVTVCTAPRGEALADPAAELKQALASPYEWPPLAVCTVPGDRIALALHPEVTRPEIVVAGIIESLVASGADPAQIALVLAPAAERGPSDATALLSNEVRQAITIVEHNPDDAGSLAYLAATSDARPIYLNRALDEADFVIPIGSLRCSGSVGYYGIHQCLFPVFSNRAAREFLSTPGSGSAENDRHRKTLDLAEATNQLGVRFSVQIVPGAGDDWLHVLAGDIEKLALRGQLLMDRAWRSQVASPCDFVVAALAGNFHQNWDSLLRAVALAAQVAADQATLVFLTSISKPPDLLLRRVAAIDDSEVVRRLVRKQRSPLSQLAELLHSVRQEARVYLVSSLPGEDVEEAGFSPLGSAEEIARIARKAVNCLVVPNAQYTALTFTETA